MELDLLYFGGLLLTLGFAVLMGLSDKSKKYRNKSLSTAYKDADVIHRRMGKLSKEKLLAELDEVLSRYAVEKGYSNAPRDLFIIFLAWGALSIFGGLTYGEQWLSVMIGTFALLIVPFFVLAIIGLMRMIKE